MGVSSFGIVETQLYRAGLALMSSRDPKTCRGALREIGEIAAVAVLPDSQMTDQEALQKIAALAEWVRQDAPTARAECGDVIRRLNEMTASVNIDGLSDREALDLFSEVLGTLEMSGAEVFSEASEGAPEAASGSVT